MIRHSKLLKIVSYDPDTGVFRLLVDSWRRSAGTIINKDGLFKKHRRTTVNFPGCKFGKTAGQLAWFYMTGKWSKKEIDHRDGDGWNNRWDNLREATHSQNQFNTPCYVSNAAGKKCVFLSDNKLNPWRAQIAKDKRRISLGYFKTMEDAHAAYQKAAAELHGEFARTE